MNGKGRELANMTEKPIDIMCVHEFKWMGSKARFSESSFKLFYCEVNEKKSWHYFGARVSQECNGSKGIK